MNNLIFSRETAPISLLIKNKLYYASANVLKNYILSSENISGNQIDQVFEEISDEIGLRHFEDLPIDLLRISNSYFLKYIYAKKLFKLNRIEESVNLIKSILNKSSSLDPYLYQLLGSSYAILKKTNQGIYAYEQCINKSKKQWSRYQKNSFRERRIKMNHDYCIVGKGRIYFSEGKFDDAYSVYLDLDKSSYIWPEILFEEAWNSFYLNDYNRTLGKLVTYKAPIFNSVFIPEIDVLRALTYMKLCLWADVSYVVDQFYENFLSGTKKLNELLEENKENLRYFYHIASTFMSGNKRSTKLFNIILSSLSKDPVFQEIWHNLKGLDREYRISEKIENSNVKSLIIKNLISVKKFQEDLLGAYIYKNMITYKDILNKSLEDMSYIKLEVLSRKKKKLYNLPAQTDRLRGDIRNLIITDKQYFWDFNGEFWADELGDYVFSLESKCI